MNTVAGIVWAEPQYMYILPVIICMILMQWYRVYKIARVQKVLAGPNTLIKHFSLPKTWLKFLLYVLGVISLFLALLRPQWGVKERKITQKGRDLFIALDVSRSMLVKDCDPDRLTYAKNKIRRLIKYLSAERVGLILFSGSAFVQCPLTTDLKAFLMFLDGVSTEIISSGSTAISRAIEKALEAYKTSDKKSKLLVLFTDGEDFSTNLNTLKEQARQVGLHMFTIGVGTPEGAPIPFYDKDGNVVGHQKDDKGSIVISRLNEIMLANLAHDSGGTYISLSDDDSDIAQLIKQVQTFEKSDFDDMNYEQKEDRYHYFLLISFICFALEWIL